jgi:hypothetical protein
MEFSRPPHGLRLLVTAWLLAGVAAARSPRCPNVTWCGNVEVRYPYGLDKECAIHEDFHLSCTPVDGVSKLFHGKMEVTKISVQDNKAWLKTWISRQCYDQSREGMIYNDAWMNLTGTVYVLSANDNRIIVLGCRGLAYMLSDSVSKIRLLSTYQLTSTRANNAGS